MEAYAGAARRRVHLGTVTLGLRLAITQAEKVLSQGGRGDALLRRMPPYQT